MTANRARTVASRAAAAAVAIAVLTAGCTGGSGAATTAGGTPAVPLVEDGTLTVCSDIPYKPFEYPDEADPERFRGYDVDTIEAVATLNGWQTSWVVTPTDSIFDALDSGNCDVIASALSISDERRDKVDFSTGYFDAAFALVVRADDEDSVNDLRLLAGKRIGVQSGTEAERYVDARNPGATVVRFPGDTELFTALDAGEVDAVVADLVVGQQHTSEDDSIAIVRTYPTGEAFGFAVKKGANPALVDVLNDGVAKLKSDGRQEQIFRDYFPDVPEGD